MLNLLLKAFVITLGLIGPAMAQERILTGKRVRRYGCGHRARRRVVARPHHVREGE